MKIKNKKILITGASSGIGKATAQLFIKEGAEIIAFDLVEPDYDTLFHKVDVRKEDEIFDAFQSIESLDVVVNAAGIYFLASVEETSKQQLDDVIDTNVKGTYLVCKHALPILKKSRGNVINIASGLGVVPDQNAPAYCATKAAVIMLTKCLSQQYGKEGVRVNALLPGPVDTPMLQNSFRSEEDARATADANPMKRVGKPEEVAAVALFLASDEASYVNGAEYAVDGGESASSLYSN